MRNKKGFTLIELLTVVAIIAILAAIAIPQFSAYRKKAYNAEVYVLGGDIRKEIQEFYEHTGRFPVDNAEAGLPEPKYLKGTQVESITVRNGAFDIQCSQQTNWETLSVRPAVARIDPTLPLQWVWDRDIDVPVGANKKVAKSDYVQVGEVRTKMRNRY